MGDSSAGRLLKKYGPWALVTGASSGIGKEIAGELAMAGFDLVIHGRNQSALDELAVNIRAKGRQVCILTGDLSREDAIQSLLDQTRAIDIGLLVAAAGYATSGLFSEGNLEEEKDLLDVNVRAVLIQVHTFIQRFKHRKQSGILLISSILGFQGVPYAAHYAATKAYIQSLGEGLARELKPMGIDVLVAAPGPVHTGFASRAGMQMKQALQPSAVAKASLQQLGKRATLLPGWLSKLLYFSLALLPRAGKVRIMQTVMKGMVQEKNAPTG